MELFETAFRSEEAEGMTLAEVAFDLGEAKGGHSDFRPCSAFGRVMGMGMGLFKRKNKTAAEVKEEK
jgi:hypothetical protein